MARSSVRVCVALLTVAAACGVASNSARAIPIENEPLFEELLLQAPCYLGGTSDCRTTGSYDPTSFIFLLVGTCIETHTNYVFDQLGDVLTVLDWRAGLAGLVDNAGQVLGGTFAAFGSSPDIGINESTLLMAGTFLEAYSGTDVDVVFPFPPH